MRQEAIKQIKQMKEDTPEGNTPQEIKDIINSLNGAINWIMRYFNIKDKDLIDEEKDHEDFKYDGEFALFKDGTKIKMFTKCGSVTKAWKEYALNLIKERKDYNPNIDVVAKDCKDKK